MKTYQNPNTAVWNVQLVSNICGLSSYGTDEGDITTEPSFPFAPARKLYI